MSHLIHEFPGLRVLVFAADGPPINDGRTAADLLGEAFGTEPDWAAIPVARLAEGFFRLRTGLAGEVIQKFVNYGVPLAIVGDIAGHLAESEALAAFVRESNRGSNVWFVETLEALAARAADR